MIIQTEQQTIHELGQLWTKIEMQNQSIVALLAQVKRMQAEVETYKRLYEQRGVALARPCIACGHEPAVVRAALAEPDPVEAAVRAEREAILALLPGGYSVDPQWLADAIRARGER